MTPAAPAASAAASAFLIAAILVRCRLRVLTDGPVFVCWYDGDGLLVGFDAVVAVVGSCHGVKRAGLVRSWLSVVERLRLTVAAAASTASASAPPLSAWAVSLG